MPRSSRLAIWCLALLLSIFLYLRGRVPAEKGEGAALFRAGAGTVTVRLAGDFPRPGLYRFPDGTTTLAAIKMTLGSAHYSGVSARDGGVRLASGDIVTLTLRRGERPVFSVGRMAAKERMLLGIRLNPDLMEADDWAALPGIGPVLSARIAADRHQNGAFGSVEALSRVPGIGPAKLAAIRKFFYCP